jgi:hypothetical protein
LIGCPKLIMGSLFCRSSQIKTFNGVKRVDGHVYASMTKITSLKGIEKTNADMYIGGSLILPSNCTHLLGLALIAGVNKIRLGSSGHVLQVIHDPFLWQEKLLDLGLVEQAQI